MSIMPIMSIMSIMSILRREYANVQMRYVVPHIFPWFTFRKKFFLQIPSKNALLHIQFINDEAKAGVMIMQGSQLRLALQICATYIGTVIGAGFASGQEIVQFFTMFGSKGLIGIILTGLLFCWLGVKILLMSHRIGAQSYQDLICHICGYSLGSVFNVFVALFLLGGLCVMLAGTGSICAFYLNLPYNLGVLITVLLSVFIVLYGIRGIMAVNSIVVPLLISVTCVVSIFSLVYHGISVNLLKIPASPFAFTPYWLLSPLLYVAYNMTLALTLLVPMGGSIKDLRALIWGGLLGGAGLGFVSLLLVIVTLAHYPATTLEEIPMLFITKAQGLHTTAPYIIVLWAEMLTTAVASLYGFAQVAQHWTGIRFPIVVLGSVIIAFMGSQWGFSHLIGTLYPLFGYLSLLFMAILAVTRK